jgi:hypothetical protein
MKSQWKLSLEILAVTLSIFSLGASRQGGGTELSSNQPVSSDGLTEAVVEKTLQLRVVNPSLNIGGSKASCDRGCSSPKMTMYGTCNAKNNYLEREILDSKDTSIIGTLLKNSDDAKIIKDICFLTALNSANGPFKYCGPNDKGAPQTSVPKACISENYTKLTRASFEKVAQCLGDYLSESNETSPTEKANNKLGLSKPAEDSMLSMFELMSWESGLHTNARAKVTRNKEGKIIAGGSGGSGQLTQGAIDAVNKNELALMCRHLSNKGDSCKDLKTTLETPMKAKFSQSCDRLSLSSGNPMKNMAYAVAYQKQSRRFIRNARIKSAPFKDVFASLSGSDEDYLERNLAMWAHNTGDAPIQKALQAYLRLNPNARLRTRADVDKLFKGLVEYMAPHVKNRFNPKEPLGFYSKIQSHFKQIEKYAGGGSCLVQ